MNERNEWHYADEETNEWKGPLTLSELDTLHAEGSLDEFASVINVRTMRLNGPMAQGIPYSQISRINVEFVPPVDEFVAARAGKATTVLAGPNNCGKTLLLKNLFSQVGKGGYLVACNRFSHVGRLNTRERDEAQYARYYDQFMQGFHTEQQNREENDRKLEQIITGLNNVQRDKLFDLAKELIGNTFSIKRLDEDNEFSPFYIDMDGEDLGVSSSGTRLLLTLLGICLDDHFATLLIDEPELGLSPKVQSAVAQLLFNPGLRQEYLPHLEHIYVATHSHLLLDRTAIQNNFVVKKNSSQVEVLPIETIGAFHELQFTMLGNDLEALFLPSAIVIVEGDSDFTFLSRIFGLYLAERKVTVVRAKGDDVLGKLNVIKEAFGDLERSPYRNRIFVVLDSVQSVKLSRLERQGIDSSNIFVWPQNGIEYYYPPKIVAEVFSCTVADVAGLNLESDPIEYNGIRKTKKELSYIVAERMNREITLHGEVQAVVSRIADVCG